MVSVLVMAHRDGNKYWLAQATASVVVIGVSQKPQQQTGENKNRSEQQWFDH